MAFNDDIQYQIQRYLEGEMSKSEQQAFEQAMAKDKALAEEVTLQREIEELLADTPENALRKNLQTLSNQVTSIPKESGGSWKKFIWLAPLLLVATLWLWNGQKDDTSKTSTNSDLLENESIDPENIASPETFGKSVDTASPTSKDTIKTESVIPENEKENIPTTSKKEEIPQKDSIKKPVYAEKENLPIEQPMIFAAPSLRNHDFFAPLSILDSLIEQNFKNEAFNLVIEKKLPDTLQVEIVANTTYPFEATLETADDISTSTFGLYVYPNHAFFWNGNHPWSFTAASIQTNKNNTYQIRVQPNTNLEPGRYYYALRQSKTGKIYFVEQFLID